MKHLLTLLLIVVVVQAAEDKPWDEFRKQFSLSFNNTVIEQFRQGIFDINFAKIQKYTKLYIDGKISFDVGVNEFADLDTSEFVRQRCGTRINLANQTTTTTTTAQPSTNRKRRATLPASVDWRTKGAVTAIKNQGQCGSCWSFSANGALEAQTYKKTSKLVSLSEQNLIDCSSNSNYGNQGCNGGLMDNAFNYIKNNDGVDTESYYPYKETQSTCRYNAAYRGATVTGHVNLPQNNEDELQNAVANIGPISIAMDASLDTFQFYKSGIYYDSRCSSTNLNHGVLVVGYGTENGADYWLVKNSWGTSWGIDGYVKMARNRNNHCGVASWAVYPTV